MTPQMQKWLAPYLQRFDALTRRERALVAAALIGGVWMVGNSVLIDLPLTRLRILGKQLQAEQQEFETLQTQLATLKREMRDPDADNRRRLADLRQQLNTVRTELAQNQSHLVKPQDVSHLLDQLLARHTALRLVSLRNLPAVPANAAQAVAAAPSVGSKAGDRPQAGSPAATAPAATSAQLWRHGIELRLQGSYMDLLAYVGELEGLQQRLGWGAVELRTDYPRSELSLTVHTYSLDPAWLSL